MTQSTAFKTEWDKLFIGGKWVEPSTVRGHRGAFARHRRAGRQGAAGGQGRRRRRVRRRAQGLRRGSVAAHVARRSAPRSSAAAVKLMEERADELKFLLAAETGQPPTIVDMMQYGAAMSSFQYFAGAADKFTWRDFRDGVYGQTMVVREPIGVVGAVTAWNVPFFLAANKLGPALLAGCTIVRQARRRDAAVAVRDGRDLRRGRAARGRAVGRARRPRDRTRADRQPGDRQVHLHRVQRGRQGDRQDRRREAQAVLAGTGRQVRGHHPRGRRPGLDAADAGVLRPDELRPGLCRPDPHPGAAVALRRGRREAVGRGRGHADRAARRSRAP